MKRFCLLFLLLSLSFSLSAQPDDDFTGDRILWKGETLTILWEQPTARLDSALRNRIKEVVAAGEEHTAFSFGWYDQEEFQSVWRIVDDKLVLDRIGIYGYDEEWKNSHRIWRDSDFLKEPFSEYWQDGQIVASWYTGSFKAFPEGVHPIELAGDKFYVSREKEWIFEFQEGRLLSALLEDHVVHAGALGSWETAQETRAFFDGIQQSFPYPDFPELAGKSMYVTAENIVVDDHFHLVDFKPEFRPRPSILDENPLLEARLAEEIRRRMCTGDWTIYQFDGACSLIRLYHAFPQLKLVFP